MYSPTKSRVGLEVLTDELDMLTNGYGAAAASSVYPSPQSPNKLPPLSARVPPLSARGASEKISPYDNEALLLRRNQKLEGALKRATEKLAEERKASKDQEEERVAALLGVKQEEWEAEVVRLHATCKSWEDELHRVRAECNQRLLAAELDKSGFATSTRESLQAEFEAQKKEREEREKEERIELLRRQSVRRIMNRELSSAFSSWAEMWEARVYVMARLRAAANRLKVPELSNAFEAWAEEAHAWRMEKDLEAKVLLADTLQEEQRSLHVQLIELREELESRLAAAAEEKRLALEQQLIELTGTAAEKAAMLEARSKQERIELLTRQIGRRMLNQGTSLAWESWVEFWSARSYALTRLRMAANLLKSPVLSTAFSFWARECLKVREAEVKAAAEAAASALSQQAEYRKALEEELERVQRELASAELERQAMQQRVARNLLNRDLSAAFRTWMELWESRAYALRRLREVGNQLRSPDLFNAFDGWAYVAEQARLFAERQSAERVRGQLQAEHGSLQERLESETSQLRDMYERRLAVADESKRVALERLRLELTGSVEERAAVVEARAKEERVELLGRQFGRRMLHRDIGNAWAAWADFWSAKTYALGRLRQVANLLRAPMLSTAFSFWARDALAARTRAAEAAHQSSAAVLSRERDQLSARLEALGKETDTKLAAATSERLGLLARIAELSGNASDAASLLEAQMASEKEKRVELLTRQIGRRILNRSLTGGWSAWVELWEARVYAIRRLREVANRLRAPDLSNAFEWWVGETAAAREAAASSTQAELEQRMERQKIASAEELERVRAGYEEKLNAAAEEKKSALDRLLVELNGSAEDKAAMLEARAKEDRVDLLRRQIGRRMINRGLASGWAAWYELWSAKSYALNRLRQVAARLKEPALAAAVAFWAEWSEALRARNERKAAEEAAKTLEAQLRKERFESGQLTMVRVALEDEVAALKEKLAWFTSLSSQKEEALVEQAPLLETMPIELAELKEKLRLARETAAEAEERKAESEADAAKQRVADQTLLEQLLAEQRRTFGADLMQARESLAGEREKRSAAEVELRELKSQLGAAKVQLTGAEQAEAELKRLKAEWRELRATSDKSEDELRRTREKLKEAKANAANLQAELTEMSKRQRDKSAAPPAAVPEKPRERSRLLAGFDFDESPDAPPVKDQLAGALRASSGRVMDLFREWDTDGDGEVSRKEFHSAMAKLGLDVPKEAIDDLFSEWDADGGGSLEFRELQKILRSHTSAPIQSAAAALKVASAFKGLLKKDS